MRRALPALLLSAALLAGCSAPGGSGQSSSSQAEGSQSSSSAVSSSSRASGWRRITPLPPRSPVRAISSGKNRAGKRQGFPRTPP